MLKFGPREVSVGPLLGILFLGVALLAATAAIGGVRINTSYSLPLGIYVRTHDRDARLIEFCPVEPFASESRERGYRTHGTACADGSVPLLKPIVAVAGDLVVLSDEGTRINGRLLPKTAPLFRDGECPGFR
jgi:type IV secretory pathway protease TraF